MLCTDCHTKLFSPLTSVKTPCFYQKLSPKVFYFFHTVQNFGNFSLKDPKSAGIREKSYAPYFDDFCHWKTPISCLACTCLRGMLLPQTYVTHHIKTGQLSVECISRYYTICMGKNKGNKKELRLIFDHEIVMLHPIYKWVVSSLS